MPQYHENGVDAWGLGGSDWQEHKSGWRPEDFNDNRWQFLVSEKYHYCDNLQRKLDVPYGAFWAVLTKSRKTTDIKSEFRKTFHIFNVLYLNKLLLLVKRLLSPFKRVIISCIKLVNPNF